MSQSLTQVAEPRSRAAEFARQAALVVSASIFVALAAHIYVPIPGTPVPLTVQNLAVLLVGLTLGSRRGFAALTLYLAEGAMGLPVFSPVGVPGVMHFIGPTGGYLMVYPFVALLAGHIFERGKPTFGRAVGAAIAGEVVLFTAGISWLYVITRSLTQAISFGLYWFVFAEVIKVMLAASAVRGWRGLFAQKS